jgi:hypothetical protein
VERCGVGGAAASPIGELVPTVVWWRSELGVALSLVVGGSTAVRQGGRGAASAEGRRHAARTAGWWEEESETRSPGGGGGGRWIAGRRTGTTGRKKTMAGRMLPLSRNRSRDMGVFQESAAGESR